MTSKGFGALMECKGFGRLMTDWGKGIVVVCPRCAWSETLPENATLTDLMTAELHHIGYDRAAVQ